ncbi:MAG TPA: hypothetical protein VFF36_17560, partial [Planctomycetota bacterium]|nr:hypothetical protein [Planctomycetota bacterium]
PLLDEPELVDSGRLEIRVAGQVIGSERFQVKRRHDTLTTTSSGESFIEREGAVKFRAELVHRLDWTVEHGRFEIDAGTHHCVKTLERRGGQVDGHQVIDGADLDLSSEPIEHARYFYGMQPASMQLAACALAGADAVSLTYYPGFTAELGPRQDATFASAPGKKLARVRVDDLIDVVCDGDRFLVLHYAQHALTIARDGYQALAAELSAGDPTGEPWYGRMSCDR